MTPNEYGTMIHLKVENEMLRKENLALQLEVEDLKRQLNGDISSPVRRSYRGSTITAPELPIYARKHRG